jgi:hypothetical protein
VGLVSTFAASGVSSDFVGAVSAGVGSFDASTTVSRACTFSTSNFEGAAVSIGVAATAGVLTSAAGIATEGAGAAVVGCSSKNSGAADGAGASNAVDDASDAVGSEPGEASVRRRITTLLAGFAAASLSGLRPERT